MKSLLTSIVKRFLPLRYHVSVDTLPIGVWFKVHQTGNKSLITRYGNYWFISAVLAVIPLAYYNIILALLFICLVPLSQRIKLGSFAWAMIYDDYIKTIKLSDEHKDYLSDIKSLALMQLEYTIEPSPIQQTLIGEKILDLKSKVSKTEVDYNKVIARMSKVAGFRINPKEVTVLEFYSYLKDGK